MRSSMPITSWRAIRPAIAPDSSIAFMIMALLRMPDGSAARGLVPSTRSSKPKRVRRTVKEYRIAATMARTKNQVTGADPRKSKPIELKNGTMEPTWAVGSIGGVCCWAMPPCWFGSFIRSDRR